MLGLPSSWTSDEGKQSYAGVMNDQRSSYSINPKTMVIFLESLRELGIIDDDVCPLSGRFVLVSDTHSATVQAMSPEARPLHTHSDFRRVAVRSY